MPSQGISLAHSDHFMPAPCSYRCPAVCCYQPWRSDATPQSARAGRARTRNIRAGLRCYDRCMNAFPPQSAGILARGVAIHQTDGWPDIGHHREHHAMVVERTHDLRGSRPVHVMPRTFIVADGAARNSGVLRELLLRPIQESAGGPTESWRHNWMLASLTHRISPCILYRINHLGRQTSPFLSVIGLQCIPVRPATGKIG
ncbi:unnamed protein product [Ciceribacter sp. T2.26MG-112.2]|nr:unnamed protein product [Ciceribacter naphthalenivorans]